MTVRELAAEAGVSPAQISNIENERSSPSVAVIAGICHALKVEVADLFAVRDFSAGATSPSDREVLQAADGITKTVLLREPTRGLSFYEVRVPAGSSTGTVNSHKGAVELILVKKGSLTVYLGNVRIPIDEDESVKFRSEINHYITNEAEAEAVFHWLISTK